MADTDLEFAVLERTLIQLHRETVRLGETQQMLLSHVKVISDTITSLETRLRTDNVKMRLKLEVENAKRG